MALQTKGFGINFTPRAPAIPGNVGAVDVKEIYDGVKQGLAAFENVRRAPASMVLADAEMKAKTLEAPMGTALAEESVVQAPLKTQILAAQAAGAADMEEAKRKSLLNRGAGKPLTGLPAYVARMTELIQADQTDPFVIAEKEMLQGLINKASATTQANPEGAIAAGVQKNADTNATRLATNEATNAMRVATSEAANAVKKDIAALNDDRLRELAASADETKRTLAANELEVRGRIAKMRTDAQAANALAAREQKLAQVDKTHQLKLSHALGALETMEQNTKHVDDLIDQAIVLTGPTTAGLGRALAFLPGNARTLRGKLDSIRANIGFDSLATMRQNSPTGGALGAVSDTENKLLQSTIDSLDQGLDPAELIKNLESVRAMRAKALTNLHSTYDRDVDIFRKPITAADAVAAPIIAPDATPSAPAAQPSLEERLKKYQ